MPLHKKMAPAQAETISNKIFFCFFTVYLTGGTSLPVGVAIVGCQYGAIRNFPGNISAGA